MATSTLLPLLSPSAPSPQDLSPRPFPTRVPSAPTPDPRRPLLVLAAAAVARPPPPSVPAGRGGHAGLEADLLRNPVLPAGARWRGRCIGVISKKDSSRALQTYHYLVICKH